MSEPEDRGRQDTLPLNRLVTFRLSRLNARLNAQAARLLKETVDISLTQWRVFVLMDALGDMTASDMVRHTAFDKAQISRTIAEMVRRGLVVSAPHSTDQRSHMISFTADGRRLFELARPVMRQRQNRLTGAMTQAELDVLHAAFDKMEEACGIVDETGFGPLDPSKGPAP